MRNLFIIIVLLFSCNSVSYEWVQSLPKPWTLNEEEVSKILIKFQKKFPDFNNRLKAINLWRVGTPYGIFKLGEEVEPDTDPLLRIDTSDCKVHVLTSLAFSLSNSWEESRKRMIDIHYKPNKNNIKTPSFISRWHYTSDRILNNPYTIDITQSLINKKSLDSIGITLNQKVDRTEFLELGWTSFEKIFYLPNKNLSKSILSKLPSVCGIAFVKKSYFDMGIVVAHEGVLIDKNTLVHASSEEKKTVMVDLLDYLDNNGYSRFDGLMFYTFQSNN